MGFNKRFINYDSLLRASESGLSNLINYINKPDCLIVNMFDGSREIVSIVQSNSDIEIIKSELKKINFYEFN